MSKLYQVKEIVPNEIRLGLQKTECGVCNLSAILNESDELDIMYGSIIVRDSGKYSNMKGFDTMFPWHFWNVDKDNNVWDDIDNLVGGIEVNKFDCKPPYQWRIKLTDGSNWDCMENGKVSLEKIDKLRKDWDKWYKGYDAIYVYNFAFIPDVVNSHKNSIGIPFTKYKSQMNWDDAEHALTEAEQMVEYFGLKK
jgi:hypothetical protein